MLILRKVFFMGFLPPGPAAVMPRMEGTQACSNQVELTRLVEVPVCSASCYGFDEAGPCAARRVRRPPAGECAGAAKIG
jgi:hypothetical protein